jgi:CBS domain-containing protein
VSVERATAGDIARLRVPVVTPEDPVARARELAGAAQWDMAVVVSERRIESWLGPEQLEGDGTAGDAGGHAPVTVSSDEDVDAVAERLDGEGTDRALVTDEEGRLLGVVYRADIEGRARAAAEGRQEQAPDVEP